MSSRLVLTLVLLLTITIAAGVAPPPASAAPASTRTEAGLLARVNNERAKRGLEHLRVSADLTAVARRHSATMARSGRLAHNPRLSRQVSGWRWLGENVAMGSSAKQMHRMLIESPPHRKNILRADARQVGIGAAVGNGRVWVTQVFRRSPPGWSGRTTTYVPTRRFADVPVDGAHTAGILEVAAKKVAKGCSSRRYCPGRALTRGQLASLLARALRLDGRPAAFRDVAAPHAPAVGALAARGITSGCSPKRYCPDAPVSRAQLASLLARALDLQGSSARPFADVGGQHAAAIAAATGRGLMRGCRAKRFCPGEPVTRAQAATVLARL